MGPSKPKKDNGYGCALKARCSDTNQSWREGCRHPGAIKAHHAWMRNRRGERAEALAVYAATGVCGARTHGTRKAYEVAGCRCPAAVRAKADHDEKTRDTKLARDRAGAEEFYAHILRAKRMTGGRLNRDPRRPWRHGKMAVSRVNLALMLCGWKVPDSTERERLAVVLRLSKKLVWDRRELTSKDASGYRTMYMSEIGEFIGINGATVRRLRDNLRTDLRDGRTQRRLADSQWRVAVRAAAADNPGRKERERLHHTLCALDREQRRALYAMRRARADYTYRAALRSVTAMGYEVRP